MKWTCYTRDQAQVHPAGRSESHEEVAHMLMVPLLAIASSTPKSVPMSS